MYLTITPQKLTSGYSQSSIDFVSYLEKENQAINAAEPEFFFSSEINKVAAENVITAIDGNSAKLKHSEPKYYSITINPSQRELEFLGNDKQKLKEYTREVMKEYAQAFNREIYGRAVRPTDILYFGKVETTRTFKGTDREIKENAPFLKKIVALENTIRKVERGEVKADLAALHREVKAVVQKTPHKIQGKVIEQGMFKEGLQTHIHLIVSRKDISNTYSLSPGSKYRSSEVMMHGKLVKRGFDRDHFFKAAEKTFDRMFGYNRNFVESYDGRKVFLKDPNKYYAHLQTLSSPERKLAFSILRQAGLQIPNLGISQSQVSFALKQLRKALGVGIRSSSIGY